MLRVVKSVVTEASKTAALWMIREEPVLHAMLTPQNNGGYRAR
jgi:hypothetical protein